MSSVRARGALFGGMMLVLGLAIAMFVELFYLSDFLAGGAAYRMNTVFKFYMQVWVLLAMGAAVALYLMIGPGGRNRALAPAPVGPGPGGDAEDLGPFEYRDSVASVAPVAVVAVPVALPAVEEAPPEPDNEDDALGWLVPPESVVPAEADAPAAALGETAIPEDEALPDQSAPVETDEAAETLAEDSAPLAPEDRTVEEAVPVGDGGGTTEPSLTTPDAAPGGCGNRGGNADGRRWRHNGAAHDRRTARRSRPWHLRCRGAGAARRPPGR
jgi:hypothetical protein